MNTGHAPLYALMLTAGIGIPIMAALNAGMAIRIGNTPAAVATLAGVAFSISLLIVLVSGKGSHLAFAAVPKHYYLSGALFLFYIMSMMFSAPKIGLANAVFLVLLGQLIASTAIDHFGLFDAQVVRIAPKRIAGLLLMALGVYLAKKDFLTSLG